ncbi:MAG: YHS domain-containing (seleno)protein [Pseudomonadota bacterium]
MRLTAAIRPMLAILILIGISMPAHAEKDPIYTGFFSNTALKGYDPVSYFTTGSPAKGDKSFSHEWQGAKWLFTSAENRDRFIAAPEDFAPQYGGYCAWAVAQGYTASGDPEVWKIVDGKLYINYNDKVGATWQEDPQGFIALGDQNWPDVLSK